MALTYSRADLQTHRRADEKNVQTYAAVTGSKESNTCNYSLYSLLEMGGSNLFLRVSGSNQRCLVADIRYVST